MTELNPCPWCLGNVRLIKSKYFPSFIECEICNLEFVQKENRSETVHELVDRWNVCHGEARMDVGLQILADGGVQHSGLCSPEYITRESVLQELVDDAQELGFYDLPKGTE